MQESRRPKSPPPWRRMRLIAALVTVATCAACGTTAGSGSAPKSGGELIWGKPAEVGEPLDPTTSANAATWEILHLTYEGLVGLDDHLTVVPSLAESWKQASPTTYVFNLRGGVKFSNGREMTVEDVVGSLNRMADPKLAAFWTGQLGIKNAQSSGPRQVKVTLTKPRTSFLAALAAAPASVLPMKELTAGSFDPRKQVLGTGPYKVAAHSQNESWSLVRNPYYWRAGTPKADKIKIRIMPDDAARTAALRDGSIDVTTFETPDSIRLLKGQAGVKTTVEPTTDYYRLDVNAKNSIFHDSRLRQALALSIDRNKIRDLAMAGVGKATGAVPVAFQGVCDPATLPYAAPDVQRAKQLVAAAGATGRTVEYLSISTVPMGTPIAQVLQRNLEAAGLKVKITTVDLGAAVKRVFSGKTADFDMSMGWSAGYADPAMLLSYFNPDLAQYNKAFATSDGELNKLIDTTLTAPPGAERSAALHQACVRAAQDANVIPVVTKEAVVAYRSDKVTAAMPSVEGYGVPLRDLARFGVK